MESWERHLERWRAAGLLDAAAAERICAWEAGEEHPARHRWQVVLALVFGATLLCAGVLLFVAAHWDAIGPGARLLTVMAGLAGLHAAALAMRERMPKMATALHACGTVACGGAIALLGQIFNMQEHWPAAVLLWALCAAAGWLLLEDQMQQMLTLLLVPAWLVCEWDFRASQYSGVEVWTARIVGMIAVVYLTAFLHSRREVMAGVLFTVGAALLVVATFFCAAGWYGWSASEAVPARLRWECYAVMLLVAAVGVWRERRSWVPVAAVGLNLMLLPWTFRAFAGLRPEVWSGRELLGHLLVTGGTLVLAWHGVRERVRVLVNYAVVLFALSVAWFYFADVMGQLGRSLGLMGLGVLFLAGGYGLERTRRRLIGSMREVPA